MVTRIGTGRAWALHLGAFILPLCTAAYLLTGPHHWWLTLYGFGQIYVLVRLEARSPLDNRHPDNTAKWAFDLQLVLLALLQLFNHVMLGVMASRTSSANLVQQLCEWIAVPAISGLTAGYSGLVLAHELTHRRNPFLYNLGRLLFAFALYEHWPHEHVRGHHPRVALKEDWSTALFGETFHGYFWRTVPRKWMSAWHLEQQRAGAWWRNRVMHGVLVELCILFGYGFFFGLRGLAFFGLQTLFAIRLLEVVDYVEHWGLRRQPGEKVSRQHSWDCNNAMTLYTLIGLSRHPDHHARASRPYHLLQRAEECAQMPYGYYGMIVLALLRNKKYRELATAELQRKQLGPFRPVGAT